MSIMDLNLKALSQDKPLKDAEDFCKNLLIKGKKAYYGNETRGTSLEKVIKTILQTSYGIQDKTKLLNTLGVKIVETEGHAYEVASSIFSFSQRSNKPINTTVETTWKILSGIRDLNVRRIAAASLISDETIIKLFSDTFNPLKEGEQVNKEKVKELHHYLNACNYDSIVLERVVAAMPQDEQLKKELMQELEKCIGKVGQLRGKKNRLQQAMATSRVEERPSALYALCVIWKRKYEEQLSNEKVLEAQNKEPDYRIGNKLLVITFKYLCRLYFFSNESSDKERATHLLKEFTGGVSPDLMRGTAVENIKFSNPFPRHALLESLDSCFKLINGNRDLTSFQKNLTEFINKILLIRQMAEHAYVIHLMIENAFKDDVSITFDHWNILAKELQDLKKNGVSISHAVINTCKNNSGQNTK